MQRCAQRLVIAAALAITWATAAVAPAAADDHVSPGQIFINNVPFNDDGTPGEPIFVSTFSEGCNPPSEFPGGQSCVYVEGSDSYNTGPTLYGDPLGVTFVAGAIDSSTVTIKSAQGLYGDAPRRIGMKEPCDITASSANPNPGSTFTCRVTPDDAGEATFVVNLTFSDPSYAGGWREIHVSGNTFPCKAGQRAAAAAAIFGLAAAADPCAPPSTPKITFANVNQRKRSALYKFKAHGATRYTCVLTRDRLVVFHRACTSPRPFPGPLKPGRYMFMVQAANDGGDAKTPAIKQFTIR